MEAIIGTTIPVFIGLTLVLFGGAGFLTGQALAHGWQSGWKLVPYCLLLTCGDRFLVYGLFDGELLSLSGYAVDFVVILALALTGYRLTKARKMVSQYPWIYERDGLFGWRERRHAR